MTAIIFIGPTLTAEEVQREIDAICLPPAAQGDIYRAATAGPHAIGIIDGYFENVPAVWHKEILWALSRGVQVFGSASMGALRAAELADFGMVGIGEIYRQFVQGLLEDDDEVAVTHAPAELDFRPVSEAMVNIRSTLSVAEATGVIPWTLHQDLLRIAKNLHYPLRTYDRILKLARKRRLPEAPLRDLQHWLPVGRVDQKRTDARAMIAAMQAYMTQDLGPHRPSFAFEPTRAWTRMVQEAESEQPPTAEGAPESPVRDLVRHLIG